LALAMAANRKEEECIALFKQLEETHPVRAVQRQAENLRFIMEAPKLEIGEDEKVKVPLMNLDSNKYVQSHPHDLTHSGSARLRSDSCNALQAEVRTLKGNKQGCSHWSLPKEGKNL
jgi:hypothetical protein